MGRNSAQQEYCRFKLRQATEALIDAQGLFADNVELYYVVNSLYYAFYYPVLALLNTKGISAGMQSVSIALFEKEFVRTNCVDQRFFRALQKAFDLKPKCSIQNLEFISRHDVETLLVDASEFIVAVGRMTEDRE